MFTFALTQNITNQTNTFCKRLHTHKHVYTDLYSLYIYSHMSDANPLWPHRPDFPLFVLQMSLHLLGKVRLAKLWSLEDVTEAWYDPSDTRGLGTDGWESTEVGNSILRNTAVYLFIRPEMVGLKFIQNSESCGGSADFQSSLFRCPVDIWSRFSFGKSTYLYTMTRKWMDAGFSPCQHDMTWDPWSLLNSSFLPRNASWMTYSFRTGAFQFGRLGMCMPSRTAD